MTRLTVLFITNLQVINTGGIGLVAIGAIQFFAIGQGDADQMQLMVKLQTVRVLKLVSEHLELRMVGGEAVHDFGVTALWTGGLEKNSALRRTIIERNGRLRFAYGDGSFHNLRTGMTGNAIVV